MARIFAVALVIAAIVVGTAGLSFADQADGSPYPLGIRYYTGA